MKDEVSERLRKCLMKVGALALFNAICFLYGVALIGGSASHIENGRYYVNEHGRFTEVRPSTYYISKYHRWSVAITFPFGIIYFYLLNKQRATDRQNKTCQAYGS